MMRSVKTEGLFAFVDSFYLERNIDIYQKGGKYLTLICLSDRYCERIDSPY